MKNTIKIAPLDAALVLRGDGTFEVWLPHIHEDPPPNATAMSALMCAYHDKRIMALIREAMDAAGYEYLDPPQSLTPAGERPSRASPEAPDRGRNKSTAPKGDQSGCDPLNARKNSALAPCA
jgi:hypothetical protein